MKISNELRTFLKNNCSLLNNNEFEELFQAAANQLGRFGELYSLLINAGIDILPYVTEIPAKYFAESNIESIVIPKNIIQIGWGAFKNCKNLKYVAIPNSVTRIGDQAFQGCTSLGYISLPQIDCLNNYTFSRCLNLKSVQFPVGLKKIKNGAFEECKSLGDIHIPESVVFIEFDAFCDCQNLKNVSLGTNILEIGADAFYGCDNLEKIEYRGTINEWKNIDISGKNENIFQCVIHCIDGDFVF